MKILIVHNKYQSINIGGEDIVYKDELYFLEKKLGKENVFSYEVSNDNINKFELIFNIWFSFKHYRKIKNLIQKNNIDIVHVHNFFPILTPSIFKAAKDAGAKTIHTLHNYRLWCISGIFYRDNYGICEVCSKKIFSLNSVFYKCYRKSLLQSIIAELSFSFYKLSGLLKYIDYYFVLTEFQKKKVISLGLNKNKIFLKPNGLNIDISVDKKKGNYYVYVGRIEESKGIFELLKIWNKLDEKFKLIIIGTGNKLEELKKNYQKNNIIFKGKLSREETIKYIEKAKYLIQSSLWYETFGLTMLEAFSKGTPVIGFNIGTRRDFIKHKVNGFICDNINTLETIIKYSYSYKNYNDLVKNAVETAYMYDKEKIIDIQIKIYKKILNEV